MAHLSTVFAGITSPNPFWLASGPPANSGDQVRRAFDAGWGGAVWKTIGEPAVEVMTDRQLAISLDDIREVKKHYPRHPVIVSVIADNRRDAWQEIVRRAEDTGCDGVELNFGGPHAIRAIGQSAEITERITGWVKDVARTPVLVKLTPNVANIQTIAQAARDGGAVGLAAISTLHSIAGVDLDTFELLPSLGGGSTRGGYGGPAVKPIALHMVRELAGVGLPVSGIGGVATWRDAAEFMLLGATTVQVCSAVMHYGFRIIEDMLDGLSHWMDEKGFRTLADFSGPECCECRGHATAPSGGGAHQPREMHRLRTVLRGLSRWRLPMYSPARGGSAGDYGDSECSARGQLGDAAAPHPVRRAVGLSGLATCAGWCVRCRGCITMTGLVQAAAGVLTSCRCLLKFRFATTVHFGSKGISRSPTAREMSMAWPVGR